MSEAYGLGAPSAATANRYNGDADEEQRGGGGPAEEDDRSGIDSDEQKEEHHGGVADEMADEEGSDSESEDGDGAGAGDDMNEDDSELSDEYSDSSDDGYEEEGHPVVAATGVTVPDGCVGPTDIEARFPLGTNEATKQLGLGVIGRTIIDPRQVTALIRQNGADPDVKPRLRKKGSKRPGFAHSLYEYPLLCLAIDNQTDYTVTTIVAGSGARRFVALPKWSSAGLQAEILTALLDGGADINATDDDAVSKPLWVAIALGNQTAFDILTARQDIDLRPPGPHMVMELPRPLRPPPPRYLEVLMSMYRQVTARDPTLATEHGNGHNLVHMAAMVAGGQYPQSFIDAYLDLITANGADMTAVEGDGWTPLHYAESCGSPHVADYLCRKVPAADDINRRTHYGTLFGNTPLALAAEELDRRTQRLQHPHTPENTKKEYRAKIDEYRQIIHSLLRAGADINSISTATEWDRCGRQLVLAEYATILNELPAAVTSAVSAALAPHRSLAALLTPQLAVGPQEAAIFGWRIASYLFDMDAAQEAVSEAGVRHTDMAHRVCAAAEHFVRSAVYQASSNREVVGGTADVGSQVVRVPQLQCFVVGGMGGRKMELREMVQRAILDEAAQWGLAGEIGNGFSRDVPAVVWGAVGWVERGRDGRKTFRSLRMT
ncbi:unnamed protein product [Vitrella brassicaformis CCMP3155]|uniref:Uncharacterized protein n=1 Tax=Vitrella brassicaformis (strain CCMP3155) TaxID=1169540 RepID=A0A0G4EVG8_VITBC|nr:unnamed protein product [Vitrella brassicaformis CCMP3155]|eukprot:CEM02070.1 unnamed protein product [Vitrella brassicaformis CCMP3155]